MHAADWIQLIGLVVLAAAALGFGLFVVIAAFAALLATGFSYWGGYSWVFSFEIALAIAAPLPILVVYLRRFSLFFLALIVVGIPATLLSHFAIGSIWVVAAAHGAAIMFFLPPGVVRILVATGLVEKPDTTSSSSSSHSSYSSYSYFSGVPEVKHRSELRSGR